MPSLAASRPRYDPQRSVNSMEINKRYGHILREWAGKARRQVNKGVYLNVGHPNIIQKISAGVLLVLGRTRV